MTLKTSIVEELLFRVAIVQLLKQEGFSNRETIIYTSLMFSIS